MSNNNYYYDQRDNKGNYNNGFGTHNEYAQSEYPTQQRVSVNARHMPQSLPQMPVPSPQQTPFNPGAKRRQENNLNQDGYYASRGNTYTQSRRNHRLPHALLGIVCWLLRLVVWGFLILIVANAVVVTTPLRLQLMEVTSLIAKHLPSSLAGILVIALPTGGVLRGDLLVAALLILIGIKLLKIARRAL